jgi:mannosyl-3-phosphoglycerate phosphatase
LTIGLGDSLNDLPLLESVDIPVLMGNKDGSCEQSIEEKLEVRRAEGIGPRAWNRAVLDLIDRHELKAC